MKKIRNRLLILLALLTIGLAPIANTAYALDRIPTDPATSDPVIGPYTGDPDLSGTGGKTTTTHSASNLLPSDGSPGASVVVSRAMWVRALIRIWAAMHWGVGQ